MTQLPKLLIALRAVSFGTRQVKKRAEGPPCGDTISYTRPNTLRVRWSEEVGKAHSVGLRVSRKGCAHPCVQGRGPRKGISVGRTPGKLKTATGGLDVNDQGVSMLSSPVENILRESLSDRGELSVN